MQPCHPVLPLCRRMLSQCPAPQLTQDDSSHCCLQAVVTGSSPLEAVRAALDAAVAGLPRGADAAAAEQATAPGEQAPSAASPQLGLQVSPLPRMLDRFRLRGADPGCLLHTAGSAHKPGCPCCACISQHPCSLGAARRWELELTTAELRHSCPGVLKAMAVIQDSVQDIVELLAELWGTSGLPGRYARAVLAELVASAQAHGLPAPPAAHLLDLQISIQLGLGSQVKPVAHCLCTFLGLCLGSRTTAVKPVPAGSALSGNRPTLRYGLGFATPIELASRLKGPVQVASSLALQPLAASIPLAEAIQAHGSEVPDGAALAARMLSTCQAHQQAVLALLAQGQVRTLSMCRHHSARSPVLVSARPRQRPDASRIPGIISGCNWKGMAHRLSWNLGTGFCIQPKS